jgi:hypothetical protein
MRIDREALLPQYGLYPALLLERFYAATAAGDFDHLRAQLRYRSLNRSIR